MLGVDTIPLDLWPRKSQGLHMSNDLNPYETSTLPSTSTTTEGRKFKWRTIPFVVMLVLGGLLSIVSLWQACCGVVWLYQFSSMASFSLQLKVIAFALLPSGGAAMCLSAALYWRRGWWISAIVFTLVGFGLFGLTDTINPDVVWPPPPLGF